jgi:heme-degrading monooxygenase HmoA
MFIAMNRFKVQKGSEADFEQVWLSRETHLEDVPGFLEFHLLKGPERDDHVLYASHSLWLPQSPCPRWRG